MHPTLHHAVQAAQPGWLAAWAACAAVAAGRAPSLDTALAEVDAVLRSPVSRALCAAYAPLAEALAADPGLLGDAYAAASAPESNRARGRFYTPAAVVEAVLPPRFAEQDVVLDPACGGGRFLLGALARHPAGARGLWGVDVDPVAAAVCRVAVWLACGARPRVDVGDPLAGHAGLGPLRVGAGVVSHVVGNPPFRAARRGASLQGEAAAYRRAFAAAEYQLDPYVLFLELGLHALRPGGSLRLIVPNAWSSNVRAGRLRRLLTAAHGLEAVIELPEATFAAGVETVVVQVRAGGQTPAAVPVRDLSGAPRGVLLHEAHAPAAPMPLARTAGVAALLEASRGWATTLGDVAEVTRGINPYHHTTHTPDQIAARVHHATAPAGPTWRPEFRGRDLVGAYRLWPSGQHFVEYGPWLKEPRAPRFFEGPRLLVRKVLGATICAAYHGAPMVCDQSVYIALLRPGQPWPPGALLACVNSRLMATLLRARHQEDDRLFPQLKVGELRALPLPPCAPDAPEVQAVAAAAMALQADLAPHGVALAEGAPTPAARRRRLRAGWPADAAVAEALAGRQRALDAAVARLYGVDPGAMLAARPA